jgi:hypothetical protein
VSMTTTTGAAVLSPSQINELIVLPFIAQSAAMRVGTVTQISSHSLRIPRVTTDPARQCGVLRARSRVSLTQCWTRSFASQANSGAWYNFQRARE